MSRRHHHAPQSSTAGCKVASTTNLHERPEVLGTLTNDQLVALYTLAQQKGPHGDAARARVAQIEQSMRGASVSVAV